MHSKIRYAAYSLVGIPIVLTLLLAYPEVNRSRAKARGVVPAADLRADTTDTVPGKVTLYSSSLKTSAHFFEWAEKHFYCGTPHAFEVRPSEEDISGTVVAGFQHRYNKGAAVAGCPEGDNTVYRGSVWFDLSDITSKAAPLHLSVQTATLHFRAKHSCPNVELLVGTADWMKDYPDNTLVPGDPNPVAKFYGDASGPLVDWPSEGVSVDVQTVVNNWLKGEEHGGYANYGFVFKGGKEADLEYKDADACVGRFWDFSLTVNYTYDKESKLATYPLVCRGTDKLKVGDLDGPVGFRWVGFTFIPGTKPANDGLLPGQCSWQDRGMRVGEPGRLAQPIEGAVTWIKDLNSPDSYWTFDVYNAGGQLQATGAKRNERITVPLLRTNVALAANGGVATASSTTLASDGGGNFEASSAVNGERLAVGTTNAYSNNTFWRDGTDNAWPDWLQVEFKGSKTINEIDVYTLQDDYLKPIEPTESMTFNSNGITDFDVQYWNGKFGTWVTIPGGSVTGNNKVWRKFTFPAITTIKIRVFVNNAKNRRSRIVELEAWGT